MKRTVGAFFLSRSRSRRAVLHVLGVSALLAACAAPGPRTIRVAEAELNAAIARQIPTNSRYLEMFDIGLRPPQLILLPEENRLRMEMEYSLGAPLFNGGRFSGWLQLSYGLRVDAADAVVRLADVRVERMDIPGVPPAYETTARRIGAMVAERLLRDMVVHRLRPEDLQRAARYGYRPGAIRVVPGAIELRLEPM